MTVPALPRCPMFHNCDLPKGHAGPHVDASDGSMWGDGGEHFTVVPARPHVREERGASNPWSPGLRQWRRWLYVATFAADQRWSDDPTLYVSVERVLSEGLPGLNPHLLRVREVNVDEV